MLECTEPREAGTGWCIHLIPWPGDTLDVPRYRCARFEFIRQQPFADVVPAFGGGCCMPLFNADRDRVVRALRVVQAGAGAAAAAAVPGAEPND